MARDTKNLTRLPSGIFQIELALPADIRALTGKRTWRKSTNERDPKKAAALRDETIVEWRQKIKKLRNPSATERLKGKIVPPSDWPGTNEEFISDMLVIHGENGDFTSLADIIRDYVDSVRSRQSAARIAYEIAEVPFPEEPWKEFFIRAERIIAIAGAEDEVLTKLMAAPAVSQLVDNQHDSVPISKALESWKTNTHPRKTTASAYDVMVRRFVESNGDLLVSRIGRQHVRAFRDNVESQVKSAGTVKNLLSKLSALLNWAKVEGYRNDDNPVKGIVPTKNVAATTKKKPFDAEDINNIHRYIARTYQNGDDRYWLFTAALLSGLRAEELCALRSCDVREINGVWCFDINPDGDKFVKNMPSVRLVPVHQRLIQLGILEHHQRNSASGRLFPTLQADDDDRYSGYWLNQINHVLHKKLGFGADKSFHSTRHAFQDSMRNAGIEITLKDRLFGHAEGGGKRVAANYGSGHSIRILNEGLQKVSYPGVDWSILNASANMVGTE